MEKAGSPYATRVGQDPTWWARGLALAERLAGADGADGAAARYADVATGRDRRRLDRWRATHRSMATMMGLPEPADAGAGSLAARLAEFDLDESALLALLAEPPAELAARRPRPTWAGFVEEVVSAADAEPCLPDGGLTWAAGFTAILAPFVTAASDRFVAAAGAPSDVDLPAVRADFADHLGSELIAMAARTLVLELNVLRVGGGLTGDTPQQRFASFVRRFACRPGLAALLGEYAVLARLLAQACANAVDAWAELLRRYTTDRDAMVTALLGGADPGVLAAVSMRGDLHQSGRSVAVLRFAGGARVVYKPRPVTVHDRFNAILRWLNSKVTGLDLRTLAVLCRDGYGWVEFAVHEPCRTADEVAAFYRRLGSLTALLYALDATDIHCENLIASGDQPVLVDLETLLHPALAEPVAGADPANEAAESSVRRILLLPTMLIGERGALDVSGVGGDAGATSPLDVVGWQAPGTDEMRLIREAGMFPGAENRPRLGSDTVDPGRYVDVLVAGFRAAYDAIGAHRGDLIRSGGLLQQWADDEIRVVIRATRMYSVLLDESTHPDVMRDALDRDRVIDLLWVQATHWPVLQRIFRHEAADAWAGDIPVFFGRPGSRDLWSSRGQRLAGVLPGSSLEGATGKIDKMGPADRAHQEWVVRASLATRGEPAGHVERSESAPVRPVFSVVPDPERLLLAARAVADRIVGRAFANGTSNGTRANWLGLELVAGRHWMVRPLGPGLADGYPGVALFLAQLAELTGVERYAEYARHAIRAIPGVLDRLADDPQRAGSIACGMEGLGGLAFALTRLARLLGDPGPAEWIAPTVDLASAALEGHSRTDVMTGAAGCLAATLAVHEATGLPTAWKVAGACADRLAAHLAVQGAAGGSGPAGFATGDAGIGWALLRFAAAGGGDAFRDHGLAALARAAGAAGAAGAAETAERRGWCQGAAGAALAYAAATGSVPPAYLDRAVEILRTGPALDNHSLCHGELGSIDALVVAAAHNGVAEAALPPRVAHLLGSVERWGPLCGTPDGVESPGLLSGLAGIGYGLLRVGFASRVPSVLLLQPDPPRP